ncbi:OLC1v1029656C1 [Oldenlandia corymbosa var. corymbosa]|uniref:OLC1v1029656C1 n=1 Tax=Oldenlandia corymbosa var. corymbosa TaxID=529605 RepID=A0AAV1CHP6_OLDCO|nr:OLC1v1029656C1 [Oldenlandia corymbosa var. corymbosa]
MELNSSSWSNLLKQPSPPPPSASSSVSSANISPSTVNHGVTVGSCKSTKGIAVAVVDANAIIHGGQSLAHVADRFVSVSEVLREIRDPNSRHSLNFLPFSVDTLEPSPDSLKKVISFARATGDLQTLSDVDLKLIALTYTLEAQTHGTQHLRDSPPPMHTVNVKRLPEKDLPGWGSNVPNIEEWEALENADEDELNSKSKILPLKDLNLNVISNGHPGSDNDLIGNGVECQSENQGDASNAPRNHKKYGTKKVEVKIEGKKMVADGIDATKGEVDADAGDWQPAVGRSTRRRYLRRKARREMQEALSGNVDNNDESDGSENGKNEDTECPELLVEEGSEKFPEEKSEMHATDQMENTNHEDVNTLLHQMRLEEESREALHDSEDVKSSFVEANSSHFEATCDQEEETGVNNGLDDLDTPSLNSESFDASHLDDNSSEQSWTVRSLSESSVACVTSDYAMQNVLLQMGLRLLAPGGMQIRELHRWILKCHACYKVTTDIGRVFCPSCGNGGTLRKVAATVGENGIVLAARRPRISVRGTKFSLPLPQGGRDAITKNPILREDQLPQKYMYPKTRKQNKQEDDIFMPDNIFIHHTDKKAPLQPPVRKALAVFSGKRNPNDNHYSRAKH